MQGGRSSVANLGLRSGELVDFAIRGQCMEPLSNGERVRVHKRRAYLPGDVVVVRRSNHWNAHRFLGYAPSIHGVVAITQAAEALVLQPISPYIIRYG